MLNPEVQDRMAAAISKGVEKTFFSNPATHTAGTKTELEAPLEMEPILV
jgi:hypothetical protein